MGKTDFEYEFHADAPYVGEKVRERAEQRLREIGDGHKDVVGAAVSVRKVEGHQDVPHQHHARVVVYMKPENKVAVEKHEAADQALKNAVDAVIRQIRDHWDKLRSMQRQGRD